MEPRQNSKCSALWRKLAEKEKRVQHLSQIGLKRMMNHKPMGWSGWREMYLTTTRKKMLLMAAGARPTKPKLVHAFALQRDRDIETQHLLAEKAAEAKMTHEQRLAKERDARKMLEQRPKTEAEPQNARMDALSGDGRAAELERLHQLKLQKKNRSALHRSRMRFVA